MEFKYEMKAEDGRELFEVGVVLARQFVGVGEWQVWDMRLKTAKNCKLCSSRAERIVCHDRGTRCPGAARSDDRVAIAREAIARRAARNNDRAIESVLRLAREIDREAAENEGDADEVAVEDVAAENEGDADGKDVAGPDEADAAGASEEEEEEAVDEGADDQEMVLSLFSCFSYSCAVLRSGSPPLRPVSPLRPLRPLSPLRPLRPRQRPSQRPASLWPRLPLPATAPRWKPLTSACLPSTGRQTLERTRKRERRGTNCVNKHRPRWQRQFPASASAGRSFPTYPTNSGNKTDTI